MLNKKVRVEVTFGNYNRSVKRFLLIKYQWKSEEAAAWIKEHREYMRAMWESASPPLETATLINEMSLYV